MKKIMVAVTMLIAVTGMAFSQEEKKSRTVIEVSGGMIPGRFGVEGLAELSPFGPDFYASVSHVAENSFTWNARLMAGISPMLSDWDYKDYATCNGYNLSNYDNDPSHFAFGFGIGYSPVTSNKRTISLLLSGLVFNSSYSYKHEADSDSSVSSKTNNYNVKTNTSVFMVGPQVQYVRTFGSHFSLYVDSSIMYAMSGYFHYEIEDSTASAKVKNTLGVSGGLLYPLSFGLAWKF